MADQSDSIRFRAYGFRQQFADTVGRAGPEADMSKVLRQFVRWYIGEPDAQLPQRPAPGAITVAMDNREATFTPAARPSAAGLAPAQPPAAAPEERTQAYIRALNTLDDDAYTHLKREAIQSSGSTNADLIAKLMYEAAKQRGLIRATG